MTTITHLFNPADVVYIITGDLGTSHVCPLAVEQGTVIRFRATELITETTLLYDIRVGIDNGTTEFQETDIFATLALALAEYQIRLT